MVDIIVIVIIVFYILMLFSHVFNDSTVSKSSFPSQKDIHLRNMEDESGRFYVEFYKGPYYPGDIWEATVIAKQRIAYIERVKGDSQKALEYKIDEAYKKLTDQWERENEMLTKKGIDPDKFFERPPLKQSEIPDSVEITYSVFGYDKLGETTFDMDVRNKDYEWLQDKDEEEGELFSEYISEYRPSLHKLIIKAIRKNMEEKALDPDDGMIETYVSGVHRKDFYEDASYDCANTLAEDDDIDYSVTL